MTKTAIARAPGMRLRYEGERIDAYTEGSPFNTGSPNEVRVFMPDGTSRLLEPRLELRNHSPTGFNWGYGGSGPAQLALAILADFTDEPEFALAHYQRFKGEFIAPIQTHKWTITAEQILEWMHKAP